MDHVKRSSFKIVGLQDEKLVDKLLAFFIEEDYVFFSSLEGDVKSVTVITKENLPVIGGGFYRAHHYTLQRLANHQSPKPVPLFLYR